MAHNSVIVTMVIMGGVVGIACSKQSSAEKDGGTASILDVGSHVEVESPDAGTFPCVGSYRACAMTEVCWIAGACCEQLPVNDAGECDVGQPAGGGACVGRCALPVSSCVAPEAAPAGCENMAGATCHTCPFPSN